MPPAKMRVLRKGWDWMELSTVVLTFWGRITMAWECLRLVPLGKEMALGLTPVVEVMCWRRLVVYSSWDVVG